MVFHKNCCKRNFLIQVMVTYKIPELDPDLDVAVKIPNPDLQ
jgi:hypothetical protein